MTISLPATASSAPGLKPGSDWKPAPGQETPSDVLADRFAQFFLQPAISLPDLPADAGGGEQAVEQMLLAEFKEDSAQAAEANPELPGMASSLLAAFLNLPHPVAPSGAAVAVGAGGTPLASAALNTVRAEKSPSASVQQQPVILPNLQATNEVELGLSQALRAMATEIAPQSGAARGPVTASAVPIVEARELSGERGNGSPAPAPMWSTPSVKLDDAVLPSVRLSGASSQWQQPLRQALGEQLQLQLGRGSEQAMIRLSPPMLGRVEISIRHEAGALQVHISASNSEVLRQLQGIGDGLRQDLSQRHQYNDVAVVVTPQSRQGDADGRQRQEADAHEKQPGRALADVDQGNAAFALLTDSE